MMKMGTDWHEKRVSADPAGLSPVDVGSAFSGLANSLSKEMPVRDFSRKNIVTGETVKERGVAGVILGNGFFQNPDDIIKIARFLREKKKIFHGFVRSF